MLNSELKGGVLLKPVETVTWNGLILPAHVLQELGVKPPISPSYVPGERAGSLLPTVVQIDDNPIPLNIRRPGSFIRLLTAAETFLTQEKNKRFMERVLGTGEDIIARVSGTGKELLIDKGLLDRGRKIAMVTMGVGVTIVIIAGSIKGVAIYEHKSKDKK